MATAITIDGMRGANFALVVRTPVEAGATVTAGQTIFEIENHKVVQEIEAAVDGVLVHGLRPGDVVRLDAPVAFIADASEDQAVLAAQAREAQLPAMPDWTAVDAAPAACSQGKAISTAKATEIAVLGHGAGNSLAATLGAAIGKVPRTEATPAFFQDKILDLIVYEVARLLAGKKYRKLNAHFAGGRIVPHERVIPGISFDEGGRLTLYAIPGAETLSLAETQDRIAEGLMRYVGRKLSIDEVATSTVTINDSSAADLNLTVPLLPRGQTLILSVIRDSASGFSLGITYDHRVTEGLTVANFAQELAKRVRSYAAPEARPAEAACAFCQRTAAMEVAEFRRRGLMRIIDADGAENWCCATCWENW